MAADKQTAKGRQKEETIGDCLCCAGGAILRPSQQPDRDAVGRHNTQPGRDRETDQASKIEIARARDKMPRHRQNIYIDINIDIYRYIYI